MKMKRYRPATLIITLLGINSIPFVSSFSQKSVPSWTRSRPDRPLSAGTKQVDATPDIFLKSVSLASLLIYSIAVQSITPVWADEYGRETEVSTDFTGENVMVCSLLKDYFIRYILYTKYTTHNTHQLWYFL